MSDLMKFVDARLAEGDLPARMHDTYTRIAGIARRIRSAGKTDDWFSWLTGTDVALKIGEYVLGADAETQSAKFADQLMASLAVTWSDHPEFRPRWMRNLPGE